MLQAVKFDKIDVLKQRQYQVFRYSDMRPFHIYNQNAESHQQFKTRK